MITTGLWESDFSHFCFILFYGLFDEDFAVTVFRSNLGTRPLTQNRDRGNEISPFPLILFTTQECLSVEGPPPAC